MMFKITLKGSKKVDLLKELKIQEVNLFYFFYYK